LDNFVKDTEYFVYGLMCEGNLVLWQSFFSMLDCGACQFAQWGK